MAERPKRHQVISELGAPRTLPGGAEHFDLLSPGKEALFLGLGPDPAAAASLAGAGSRAMFVECPDMAAQLGEAWSRDIPGDFTRIKPRDMDPELLRNRAVYIYRHGPAVFPDFWGPVLARVFLASLRLRPESREAPSVLLPVREDSLLVRELSQAFAARGLRVRHLAQGTDQDLMPRLMQELAQERPSIYCSINFQGLDAQGLVFHLLQRAGTRVAAWCVDNPFHLLQGARSGYWRKLLLLVTDRSFIPLLQEHGAEYVEHLPLAAWQGMGTASYSKEELRGLGERQVFVGRSCFPEKRAFFASSRLDAGLMARAGQLLEQGERPDFHWWRRELDLSVCWPGREVRAAGLGAEESGLAWRSMCLRSAAENGLVVYGDEGWNDVLAGLGELRPPVDYYQGLGAIYAQAGASLNMTSPLLPAGLTQRHFDVWACGGFLLTDNTPGLSLFPEDMVAPIRFRRAAEIPFLFARSLDSAQRHDLQQAWQTLILKEHLYEHRVDRILELLAE